MSAERSIEASFSTFNAVLEAEQITREEIQKEVRHEAVVWYGADVALSTDN